MTSQTDAILAQLRANLRGLNLSYSEASAAHDVYEGFLFSLIVNAAAEAGATVTYRDRWGLTVNSLVFRTGPGRIYSRTGDFTHAVIDLGASPPLEVHLGIRVRGTSGVLHECDLLVLTEDEASRSRDGGTDPRGAKCLLAIECKYYMSPLPLGMARGFVGLRADLPTAANVSFVANVGSPTVNRYLNKRANGFEVGVLPGNQQVVHFLSLVRSALKKHTSIYDPSYPI